MKKKALWKSIYREIFESKARFLSILGIILLGVCFYAGIKATGPVMLETADNYYEKQELMDGKIVSTMGMSQGDLDVLLNDPNVADYEAWYSQDLNVTNINRVVRFYSFDNQNKHNINRFAVTQGRMPQKSGEIVLDNLSNFEKEYKIGDTYEIKGSKEALDNFKTTSFEIVGFVNSPMFIENMSRGNTPVGKGSIDYFAVIPAEDFEMETYTEVYLRYKNLAEAQSYSDVYDDKVAANEKALEKSYQQRPAERLAEIRKEAEPDLAKAWKEIKDGEKALKKGEDDLKKGREELADGQRKLAEAESTYATEIANAENELALNNQKLIDGEEEINRQEQVLASSQQTLASSRQQLDNAAAAFTAQGIDPNMNTAELENQLNQLSNYEKSLQGSIAEFMANAQNTPDGELIVGPEFIGISGEAIGAIGNVPGFDLGSVGTSEAELKALAQQISETEMTPEIRQQILTQGTQLQGQLTNLPGQAAPLWELVTNLKNYQAGRAQLNAGQSAYDNGVAQLAAARQGIIDGRAQLNNGYAELETAKINGQAELAKARQTLVDAEVELTKGEKTLAKEKKKLDDGKKELAKAEKELADLEEPEYFFFDREDNPGYHEYFENSQRISSIATVFPVFFFLIAALVSLTTMTRMVDEKRSEIGTLKALGYRNGEIAQKYLIYATVASLIGTGLGLLIGYNVFPQVIIDAYGALYNLPAAVPTYYLSYALQSVVVALMCTTLSAMVVLRYDLFSTPAILMRPKAPKAGQRIFLERLTFIWKRLSFNHKVTARNLFRYKQRMFMTVFGIAGCMALLITGFGLRDSISDVVTIQFDKLWHYQGIVTYKEDPTKAEQAEYEEAIEHQPDVSGRLILAQQSMRVMKKGTTTQTVTVDVPQDTSQLADFVLYNDRKTGEVYELKDDGVIINEKLAKMFKLKPGSTFELTGSDDQKYPVKVSHVIENYAMHYVYLTPKYYEEIFQEKPEYNSELLLFKKDLTSAEEDKIATTLMENDQVINVTFLSETSEAMDDTIDSLTIVVWVLIVSAALLAFIVLYNLTNINISERIRELSTIKVLGFYNKEVTMYVYRENNILTALGILVGCFLGKLLHRFVLETAEVDMLMFSPTIHWQSYLYSALLTAFFSTVVMLVMHRKLKRVDMIAALKSNE